MTNPSSASIVQHDLDDICDRSATDLRAMEGATLLLTGGGGFLGHHLVQAVLAWNRTGADRPITLVVADNWSRGTPAWLEPLRVDPHLHIATVDVTEPWPDDLPAAEWNIHAASIASPIFYRKHPIETMDANVDGLRRLLDRCDANQTRGVLFFSSSEVYGDPDPSTIPTPETYNGNVSCTGPRACYDESKRYGETLCVNFAHRRDVPVTIVRPFNNYGPGLPVTDRRVIPDFGRNIVDGDDIVMLSSGSPRRTFCYVADAVTGYLAALVRGRRGEPYNIGADSPEISIAELAELMVDLARNELGYTGRVVTGSSDDPAYLVDNPNRRCPDITKARDELGFAPAVTLEDGLRRTLRWYRSEAGGTQ